MSEMTKTLRMIEAGPGIFAYYDGRIDGMRLYSPRRNWLDDGAYGIGLRAGPPRQHRQPAAEQAPRGKRRIRRLNHAIPAAAE
ncbi:hypothetical protein AAIH46_07760 [Rhizobium sp. 0TCS1.26]|uniref:hypothetical protein n=1 Tax=Rhizobium sp. 0TCS1.26 TaxID=3142623 RepID=UPI003D2B62E2